MGKRKKSSKKPQAPKKKEPLATIFSCLFCNHEKSVIVKLDKRSGIGELHCKVCGQNFQTGINYLSAAVDVYSDWIDACDAVKRSAQGPRRRPRAQNDEPKDVDPGDSAVDADADLPQLSFGRFQSQDALGEDI